MKSHCEIFTLSAGKTACSDFIATSIIESSGSRVVRYWSHSPGNVASLTIEFCERAENRIISYASPATIGNRIIRDKILSHSSGQPRNANTKILTSMTISRKAVPHLGCKRGNFFTFSTVSGKSAS